MKVVSRVQVTLEVSVLGSWHEGATLGQVTEAAVKEATDMLRSGTVIKGLTIGDGHKSNATVIGNPHVVSAIAIPEKST